MNRIFTNVAASAENTKEVSRHSLRWPPPRFLMAVFLLVLCARVPSADAAEIVYERDIAPILRTYCAGCHNDVDIESELSVERFSSFRKGGMEEGDPILPGQPDESFMIRSLERRAKPYMPPKDEPRVPAAELALLKRWIAEGAHGPANDASILETLVVPGGPAPANSHPAVTALARSSDGKQFAIGSYGRVEIRSKPHGPAKRVVDDLPGKVNAVHFSPDGEQVVVATGITGLRGVARVYDLKTGDLVREFAGHRDTVQDAEFSPDGATLATAGYDRLIKLWRTGTGELLHTLDIHNGAVFDLAFDPSGAVLASASADQTIKLWRVSDGLRLDTLSQPQGELYHVAFTPDGKYIVGAGLDRRIHLWKFVSRNRPESNPVVDSRFAHDSAINVFVLMPDGHALVTAGSDRTLKVWSVPELVEQHAYELQSDVTAALVAYPGGTDFLVGRMDGSIDTVKIVTGKKAVTPALAKTQEPGLQIISTNLIEIVEVEPNDGFGEAVTVALPAGIEGAISEPHDVDVYRFHARAGADLTLAINAARSGSRLDSRVEVLFADGKPVEQVVLQAVRDSWLTFRGKDSNTSDDFRLQNWNEMELDQYLYANGEVVRLWLYPRGPDSGFKVYPGAGNRHTMFSTTALTHAVNEPAYIVKPFPAGTQPVPNGLPVYRLNYENDDESTRQWGTDSLLLFTAPQDGDYLARVTDVRGFGGETNYTYTLSIRGQRPDFSVAMGGKDPKVSAGSGREVTFTATRREGFEGPIRIEVENLPAGFTTSTPIEIEAGQHLAIAALHAAADSVAPDEAADMLVKVVGTATIGGREVRHELGSLGDIQLAEKPKVTVAILPANGSASSAALGDPLEFDIRPGETIIARVRAERHDFDGRIELGGDDSGRNLPHGVFVDNIGLNGLLIVEGQTEREFFITASPVAKPGTRPFHLRATADGGQVSLPVVLHVLPPLTAGNRPASAR